MTEADELLHQLNQDTRSLFQEREVIMSFGGFLEKVRESPSKLIRNSSQYLYDTFQHFGKSEVQEDHNYFRWKIFDYGTELQKPIIGSEMVQDEIFNTLASFNRQGFPNKLIMLHGPNGSAKSSIIESITHAMKKYSTTDEGAVYRFNWVFTTDKSLNNQAMGSGGPIGFTGHDSQENVLKGDSFAFLEEAKIASKIHSEFKENPIFLLPMPQRENWLREWLAREQDCEPAEVELPPHVLVPGLSKRNQLIYENLLAAYDGDITKVLRHVQVERFFYSRQYRVGIGTVEPQMSIDALEKQLTMDRNIANLPPVLHNISFHEASGALVEANRGILEFSDMLKRPIEAFKYLLSTIEKGTLNLPSSTANLDTVFFATTNEKHLDAFKTIPDFASFRSRFELITAPYLLRPTLEEQIYASDIRALKKTKPIAPHSVHLLCLWAVMTRLKQPNPENYDSKYRSLVSRLDPRDKVRLYEGEPLTPQFKPQEDATFRELRNDIYDENQNVVAYEGRFGASPREVRSILYRAVQNQRHKTLTPMVVFAELERLVKDRTVYEFLQLEPKGKYHQPTEFIKMIKEDFANIFEREVTQSMTLVEEEEYENLLKRYVDNVVAQVKKEKIYNKITGGYEDPSEKLMSDVEKILNISGPVERHREAMLGRIAAYKIDHPNDDIQVGQVFHDYLTALQDHYYRERQKLVNHNFMVMLSLDTDNEKNYKDDEIELARTTFANLDKRFGYDRDSAIECLKFIMSYRPNRPT
jgi:predicted Ser/Thr protein kinase